MCRFLGFKSCTLVTFMIMLKPHVYEIPGSWVKYKNALNNQIAGFLNFNISKTIGGIKLIFWYIFVKATNWWYSFT